MARPKKGEPGYEEANRRWRQTMEAKYGGPQGLHKKMQEAGAIGGSHGVSGGFAADPRRAVRAGAIGGRHSARGKLYYYTIEFEKKRAFNEFESELFRRLFNGEDTKAGVRATMITPNKVTFRTTEKRAEALKDKLASIGCIIKSEAKSMKGQE